MWFCSLFTLPEGLSTTDNIALSDCELRCGVVANTYEWCGRQEISRPSAAGADGSC